MRPLARAIEVGGLLAAISGASHAVRGDCPAVVFCATLLISAATLTALWVPAETGSSWPWTTVAG